MVSSTYRNVYNTPLERIHHITYNSLSYGMLEMDWSFYLLHCQT